MGNRMHNLNAQPTRAPGVHSPQWHNPHLAMATIACSVAQCWKQNLPWSGSICTAVQALHRPLAGPGLRPATVHRCRPPACPCPLRRARPPACPCPLRRTRPPACPCTLHRTRPSASRLASGLPMHPAPGQAFGLPKQGHINSRVYKFKGTQIQGCTNCQLNGV